ncbi:MAG: SGNH/GDSL hydrolase family protein [Clostridia bacterium]|nr:SGNH/GDSL hydrolase family protein [Clostridia bacterium]
METYPCPSHWNGKLWYAYGTSMTMEGSGHYARYLAHISGLKLVNCGEGGRGVTENIGGYSTSAMIRLRAMDPDDGKKDADLITLEVGPNDTGAPLGTIYDLTTDTFCGCLNMTLRWLQANTDAQIVLMSITGSRYDHADHSIKFTPQRLITPSSGDPYTWFDMVCAIRDVAGLNSVHYIPVAESCGLSIARMGEDSRYVRDQIHHTPAGGWNVAQFIWSRLKDVPLWYTDAPEGI